MTITNSNFNSIISGASTNSWNHITYGHISNWDVSAVTVMSNAFANKTTFNEDISGWNMENVENTYSMFYRAEAFNQYIGDWSMGNVTNTSDMFNGAFVFNKYIGDWSMGKVTNTSGMFLGTEAFNQYIGDWNMGNVTNTSHMFYQALEFNQDIGDWNMGKVTNTSHMFNGAVAFNQDIGNWNMGNVLDITDMIYGASAFNQDISGWNLDIDKITGHIIERNQGGGFFLIRAYLKITDSKLILIFFLRTVPSFCPVKAIPIIIPGNDKTKAFSYSRLVNNAFGSSTRGYRSMKRTVPLPENASGIPGGTRSSPRNF